MTVQTKIIHTELCAYKTAVVCASCLSIKIKYSIFIYYISNIYIYVYIICILISQSPIRLHIKLFTNKCVIIDCEKIRIISYHNCI